MAKGVASWLSKLDPPGHGTRIDAVDAPNREQREGMQRRLAVVETWLRPALTSDVEAWVAAVLATTEKGSATEADAAMVLSVYVGVLTDHPAFAVYAACNAFLTAQVPGQRTGFRPTTADMAAEAERQAYRVRREHRQLRVVLNAEVIAGPSTSAERRRAISDLARQTLHHMAEAGEAAEAQRQGRPYTPPAGRENPDEALRRLHEARHMPLKPLSSSVAAKLDRSATHVARDHENGAQDDPRGM